MAAVTIIDDARSMIAITRDLYWHKIIAVRNLYQPILKINDDD